MSGKRNSHNLQARPEAAGSDRPGAAQSLDESRRYWDAAAAAFDEEPDHGLRAPAVRAAWAALLEKWLPPDPSTILDVGCGTGSLALLLAAMGHDVTGVDLSAAMLARARAKAAAQGARVAFQVMDAGAPAFAPGTFDVLLCRHVLWALPEPASVLRRWSRLVRPGGRLLLIEGFWETGGGLHAEEVVAALPATVRRAAVLDLSQHPDYWGKPVKDERYAITVDVAAT